MAEVTSSAAPVAAPVSAPQSAAAAVSPGDIKSQGAPKAESAAPATHKIKVDGQEITVTQDELIALAQQGKSAGKRFQEAAAAKKQAEELVGYLKSNPKEAFKKLGIDVRKFSEDTLLEMIQHEQMSPEQRRAFENEQKLRKYEEGEKADKEAKHAKEMADLEAKHMKSYDDMFVKALTESGLPKTAYTVKRMAELTLVNEKRGLGLDPSQLAKIVREDYVNEHKALFAQSDGDALIELLGKDAVKKLSKAQLAKYKATKQTVSAPQRSAPKEKAMSPAESWAAFKKRNRSLI